MRSPLPDSSALECGLISDPPSPNRTTGVQDNVRVLLRASMISRSGDESKSNDEETIQVFNDIQDYIAFGQEQDCRPHFDHVRSPDTGPHSASQACQEPAASQCASQACYHDPDMITVLEDPLPAQIDHPDIEASDHAFAMLMQQKERRHQYHRRQRHHCHSHRHNGAKSTVMRFRILYCTITGLLLATLLSTYLAISLDQHNVGTIFHVVFIIAMMLTTILFCHSVVRLVMVYTCPSLKKKRHLRLENGEFVVCSRRRRVDVPVSSVVEGEFVPSAPIRVHVSGDNLSPLRGRQETPVGVSEVPTSSTPQGSSRNMPDGVLFPPPAYGRWRGSIRVDPNLMHWKKVEPGKENEDEVMSGASRTERGGEAPPVYPENFGDRAMPQARRVEMVQVPEI